VSSALGQIASVSSSVAIVAQTARLRIRHFTAADAPFVLQLLNTPGFLAFIGDRGVRTLDAAISYLDGGPVASYAAHGHGLNAVQLLSTGAVIGMCGVLKRDTLPEPDLGYALLPEFEGQGYAFEAATACITHARSALNIPALLATVRPNNPASIRVLTALGFAEVGRFDELLRYRRVL
jgi:[ribosomal protein S5]-alanine N-acetyltransferase